MKNRIIIGGAVCAICVSCSKREPTSVPMPHKLVNAVELISMSRGKVDYLKLQDEVLQDFHTTGSLEGKRNVARNWMRMLYGVELQLDGIDYAGYNRKVRRFNICFGCSATALEEVEPDAKCRLSYYVDMLRKYKNACFAITWSGRFADESQEAFNERKNASRVLMDEYEKTMIQWERYVMPRLLANVPANLKDEFTATFQALRNHPSKEEFRKAFDRAATR